jgi:hypothetical protein
MSEPPIPYRRPDERPALTDAERRWFTKHGDAEEKGPYAADVIVSSLKTGMLKATTLVRAEDGADWRPISSVDALMGVLRAGVPRRRDTFDIDPREEADPALGGNFLGGFAAGFFGGCIGLGLVLLIAKGAKTKRGVLYGFVTQLFVGVALRALASG